MEPVRAARGAEQDLGLSAFPDLMQDLVSLGTRRIECRWHRLEEIECGIEDLAQTRHGIHRAHRGGSSRDSRHPERQDPQGRLFDLRQRAGSVLEDPRPISIGEARGAASARRS